MLFTFPSQYYIHYQFIKYLALKNKSSNFPQNNIFHNTQEQQMRRAFISNTKLSLSLTISSKTFFYQNLSHEGDNPLITILQPHQYNTLHLTHYQFKLFPFHSPLLKKSYLLSFPKITKIFQFTPFPSRSYKFRSG